MFPCNINRRVQVRHLACDGGDDDDSLRIRGCDAIGGVGGGEETGECELGCADGVCNVDVYGGVGVA